MSGQQPNYITFLRRNKAFRRLWYGQVVSQIGDWFDVVALLTLLIKLTNSGRSVGLLLVVESIPSVLFGLWAGVLVDRLPRKFVMIATDVGRALIVLSFLLVRNADLIWIVYAATVCKVTLTSFFEPARQAAIPNVVSKDELVVANSISGSTSAAMIAIGAAIGGLVTGTFGTDTAFLFDSLSFMLSAVFISSVPISEPHLGTVRDQPRSSRMRELRDGFRFITHQRDVALSVWSTTLFSLGIGSLELVLTLFGRRVFPLGVDGALGIGLLYTARGVGVALGPIIAQRWGGASVSFLRRMLGLPFLIMAIGYLAFSSAPTLLLASLALMVAHTGGGSQWVFSTVLLQLNTPNHLQGRVFAVYLTLGALMRALASYAFGAAADAGVAPRLLALLVAATFALPGALMVGLLWQTARVERSEQAVRAHDSQPVIGSDCS